jgi:hypothetical protein
MLKKSNEQLRNLMVETMNLKTGVGMSDEQAAFLSCLDTFQDSICGPQGHIKRSLLHLEKGEGKQAMDLLFEFENMSRRIMAAGNGVSEYINSLVSLEAVVGNYLFGNSSLRQAMEKDRVQTKGEQGLRAALAVTERELQRFRKSARTHMSKRVLDLNEFMPN